MITLKKGDWENLEGRVVSYAKLKDPKAIECIGTDFLCLYATVDALDFAEKTGLIQEPEEMKKQMDSFVNSKIANSKSKGSFFVPMYIAPRRFDSEQDILIQDSDVIYAEAWDLPCDCSKSVDMGINLYLMKYAESAFQKHRLGAKNPKVEESASYADYSGKSIRDFLLREYVRPLLDAQLNGNTLGADTLGRRMLDFMQGSAFVNDGLELAALSKRAKTPREYGLIETYLQKIEAIHLQRFEDAARYRDVINAAKKEGALK